MRRTTLSLVAAAAVLAGGIAYAAPGMVAGDGNMSRAEAQQKAQQAFERMDANSDGVIGQVDRAARQKAMFDRIDADSDGSISYAEFAAMHGQRHDMRGERGGHDGHGRRGHHRMGMMGMHGAAGEDGKLTNAEFQAAALQRFDRADTDNDGTVTPQERQSAHQAIRMQMRQARQAAQAN